MKTLGLIGGLSWESTLTYYRLINEETRRRLGHLHSAPCLLYSFDFEGIAHLQSLGQWQALSDELVRAGSALASAGAEILLICSNTMHKVSEDLESRVPLALLHIADATGSAIRSQNLRSVALLGTRFTMEEGFLRSRLEERYALQVAIPQSEQRQAIHDTIYRELCAGRIEDSSRRRMREIIRALAEGGAQGIILGCTELALLIKREDSPVPLFDTAALHAHAAVEAALGNEPRERNARLGRL